MIADAGRIDQRGRKANGGRLCALLLSATSMAWVGEAHALWDGQVEPFVAYSVTHDDNVFRISGQSDPAIVLGAPSKGDTYNTTSAGLNFDLPVSRQRFTGGVSLAKNRYDQFSVLDFTERHARAIWLWQVGNALSGRLGTTSDRALASLANVQSGVQSGTPNPLETRKTFLEATYRLGARWRVKGEASQLEQSNEVPASQVNDITNEGAGLTVSYVTPADNQIGLSVQTQKGDLPNPQLVNAVLVDNSYRQRRAGVTADWTITGRSHLRASLGKVRRSFEQVPARDHEAGFYRAAYDWTPGGPFALSVTAQRDIAEPDEVNAGVNIGFVLVKGIALRPTYRATEKLDFSGSIETADWEYLGDAGVALGAVAPRSDRVRSTTLAMSYQPLRSVRLGLALRRETRTSTAALGDYKVEVLSLSARLAF
ncbi:MAG: XrtB/PEP-CTERM-associated polysaccharide biosynthesis outer membrane protein EpsL [Burkholderiales bacterium]